jgi:hypothetical protein
LPGVDRIRKVADDNGHRDTRGSLQSKPKASQDKGKIEEHSVHSMLVLHWPVGKVGEIVKKEDNSECTCDKNSLQPFVLRRHTGLPLRFRETLPHMVWRCPLLKSKVRDIAAAANLIIMNRSFFLILI